MTIKTLNQFGSILTFAIELEGNLESYYNKLSSSDIQNSDEFKKRAESSIKRKKNLERTRRENVTEITLEPIEGLEITNYKVNFMNEELSAINKMEETISLFYKEAGEKINVLESKRIFKRCHKEHNNLKKL